MNKHLTQRAKTDSSVFSIAPLALTGITTIIGLVLSSSVVSATNDSVVDEVSITVPVSCTMSGTGMQSHNAEIANGTYIPDIGSTTLHAFCNDNEGFAIYAAGYTGDEIGGTDSNKLVGTNASSNATIVSGTATTTGSPDISNWAMKLAISQDSGDTTSTNAFTIDSAPNVDLPSQAESGATQAPFSGYHVVPNEYTKVAHKNSGTDMTATTGGVKLTTTYAAYISKIQPADTYTGQVIYTLVHPSTTDTPVHPDQIGVRYHADSTYQFANGEAKNLVAYKETCTTETIDNEETTTCNYIAEEGTYMDTIPVSMWYTVDSGNHKFYFEDEAELTAYLEQNKDNLMSSTIDLYATKTFARLDIGPNVNAKFKSLASGTTKTYDDEDALIKAVRMSDTLPENFTPADENTISLATSRYPVYIWFDNTDDAGIIYVYTEAEEILLNEDSSYMFRKFSSLTDISALANWNTSSVTNMQSMFWATTSLTSLSALANWDTSSVTNMRSMFALSSKDGVSSLTDISALANWDTSNVTNMAVMFQHASSLTGISALANWDTSSVTDMHNMFYNASSLTDLSALANWNTANVTDMSYMFNSASSLTDLSPLANWNTANVTDMRSMFSKATSLTTVDVSNWDTSNVTDMSGMFAVGNGHVGDGQLTEIIGLDKLDVSNVTNMTSMFYGAGQMTSYDIADWDVSKVQSFNHMFCDNFKLESLDLSAWNTSSVKTMYDMFDDARALTTIGDVSHWNTTNLIDVGGWLNGATSFVGNNGTLDLSGWNTTNLKAAGEMFRATKLSTIDLSSWTFSSITNDEWSGAGSGIYNETGNGREAYKGLGGMFENTSSLQTVYLSQAGKDSYDAAVTRGVNTTNIWSGSSISDFTIK